MSTWDGPARTAFEEGQKKWNAAATELSDVLLGIQRAVDASAGDYRNTETKAAGLFS
jgi:WXG100 family type VII secretion target